MSETIMSIRGRKKKPNAQTIRITTVLNNGLVPQFLELQNHPVANLYEDRPAAPSLLVKRAIDFYAQHVQKLQTIAEIDKERLAILKQAG
jgi:hypothetical protein